MFPETEDGKLDVTRVQRLTVYPPEDSEHYQTQIFTRKGKEWTFNFDLAHPDMSGVDNYIRGILNTSGSDFTDTVTVSDPLFNNSRITLELGDGSIRTIRLSPPDEEGRRFAAVSGSDWVYTLPAWTSQRLFADPHSFETVTEN